MTIVSHEKATPAVQRFVLALNTHLASTPQVPAARAGTKRRIKREKESLKTTLAKLIGHKSKPVVTRQVRRRMERDQVKSLRSAAKRNAMASKAFGGAAAV